jgi:type II secretory pathway component PulM
MSKANESSSLVAAWQRMNPREQRLTLVLAAALTLFAVAGAAWLLSSSLKKKRDNIASSEEALARLGALRGQYEVVQEQQQAAQKKLDAAGSSSFSSTVSTAAGAVGLPSSELTERKLPVKDHPDYQELVIDLSFKEVSIDKLLNFVERLEGRASNGVVKVTKLKTKANFGTPDLMDVQLSVSTWRRIAPTTTKPAGAP